MEHLTNDASSPDGAGREVSVRLELLDCQLIDADDLPVGRVDDLDLDLGPASSSDASPESSSMGQQEPTVLALLVGQRHLGPRVGGITGAFLTRSAKRLSHDPSGGRVEPADVATWSDLLKLRRRLDDLDLAPLEKWLSARIVRRIPGGDDEGI